VHCGKGDGAGGGGHAIALRRRVTCKRIKCSEEEHLKHSFVA